VPAVYYGDELGVRADSVWDGAIYQDDPHNRAPMPWPDLGFSVEDGLLAHYAALGSLRAASPALRRGALLPWVADDDQRVYAFLRDDAPTGDRRWVVLHRDPAPASLRLPVDLEDGTRLVDSLSGAAATVEGGALVVESSGLQAFVFALGEAGADTGPGPDTGGDGSAGGDGADGGGGGSGADPADTRPDGGSVAEDGSGKGQPRGCSTVASPPLAALAALGLVAARRRRPGRRPTGG
jgi:uncharacterized protein (TIGR03382 family)